MEKKKFGDKIFTYTQDLGKAILLPVAVMPVAGLLLGISAALSTPAAQATMSFLSIGWVQALLKLMNAAGNGVFTTLPLIFAIGISVGLAKAEKGPAGLAAVIGFFTLNTTLNALLQINGVLPLAEGINPRTLGLGTSFGIQTLEMGVFAGILVGIITAIVHNKFYNIKLPDILAFFGGSRFVPIVNTLVFMVVGGIMYIVWPPIGRAIGSLGTMVSGMGFIGSLLYGLILRTFYIFGLHHVFYLPFWTTSVGGTAIVAGQTVEGFQNIFLAQLADPATTKFFDNLALFNSGRYIHMLFTMPAICLAMYTTIKDDKKRKATAGFILSIAITCFITGVTEPISFTLLFASPILFIMEVVFFGLGFMVAALFKVTIGSTFSAGLIEFLLFGVAQGNAKTNYIWIIITGIPFAIVTYYAFKFAILKFDYKTPGREDDEVEGTETPRELVETELSATIIEALGGLENILDIDNCATRLRLQVTDTEIVNQAALKSTGASGVLVKGQNIQVIYGPKVINIRTEVDDYIQSISKKVTE